jgi:predicted DNA-binding transcriptional regulator AlpA
LFSGTVSATWVRRNVPYKVVLGHSTVRWYAADVQAWISTLRVS